MARARGLNIQIDGLDDMVRGLERGYREIAEVMREILRGPIGDEIIQEARARLSDHTKSGRTLAALDRDDTSDGVRVGVLGDRQHIGTFLESGTRMHIIQPRSARALMLGNGRVVEEAVHPGTRANRIMGDTLRVARTDIESTLLRELDRRLARVMETTAA